MGSHYDFLSNSNHIRLRFIYLILENRAKETVLGSLEIQSLVKGLRLLRRLLWILLFLLPVIRIQLV